MTADPLSPAAVAAAAKFLSPASPPAIPSAALASAPAMRGRAASWTGEEQAQRQEAAAAAAAEEAQQRERSASSFGRALRTLSSRLTPTNYNMVSGRGLRLGSLFWFRAHLAAVEGRTRGVPPPPRLPSLELELMEPAWHLAASPAAACPCDSPATKH